MSPDRPWGEGKGVDLESRDFRSGVFEGCPDELGLRVGVCGAIIPKPAGQAALESRVLSRDLRLGAEAVPKRQLVPVAPRSGRDEMQVMGSPAGVRLAEPVHLVGEVRGVQIVELCDRLKALPRFLEVADAYEDVDDRLGVEPGNRSAADMVNPARDPAADCDRQGFSLILEADGPRGVVRGDQDRLVGRYTKPMAKTVPVRELRSNLSSLLDDVSDRRDHVLVTRNGTPAAALVPIDEYEALEETAEILSDPDALVALEAGLAEIARDETVTLAELRGELAERRAAAG
jgi:antitoxin YefM